MKTYKNIYRHTFQKPELEEAGDPCQTHIKTPSIEANRDHLQMSARFPPTGFAICPPPLLCSSFPQSSGAVAWPPHRALYVRGMSDRTEWPSASLWAQRNASQTSEQGFLLHNFKALTATYIRGLSIRRYLAQGNNSSTCVSLMINMLFIPTPSASRFPRFQTFKVR